MVLGTQFRGDEPLIVVKRLGTVIKIVSARWDSP